MRGSQQAHEQLKLDNNIKCIIFWLLDKIIVHNFEKLNIILGYIQKLFCMCTSNVARIISESSHDNSAINYR